MPLHLTPPRSSPHPFGRSPLLLVLALAAGCAREANRGPVDVDWGRDTDARCHMVIADRHFAAQVRDAQGRVWKFDDIGCAVFWAAQQGIDEGAAGVEVWVADYRSGQWLDARTAHYVDPLKTPMRYGYGASSDAEAGAIGYAEMKRRVLARGR